MDIILESEILIVVKQRKQGVYFEEFAGLFRQIHGYEFILSNYGYKSLKTLLEDMKDLFVLQKTARGHLIKCISPKDHDILVISGNHTSQRNVPLSGSKPIADPQSNSKDEYVHHSTSLSGNDTQANASPHNAEELPYNNHSPKPPKIQVSSMMRTDGQQSSAQSEMQTYGVQTLDPGIKNASCITYQDLSHNTVATDCLIHQKAKQNVTKQHPSANCNISLQTNNLSSLSETPTKGKSEQIHTKKTQQQVQNKSNGYKTQDLNRQPHSSKSSLPNPTKSNAPSTTGSRTSNQYLNLSSKQIHSSAQKPAQPVCRQQPSSNTISFIANKPLNFQECQNATRITSLAHPRLSYANICASNISRTQNANPSNPNVGQAPIYNINYNLPRANATRKTSVSSRRDPRNALSISEIKENLRTVLKGHANGITISQLQKVYLFKFQHPLTPSGFPSVRQLLMEMKDVVEMKGLGVQVLIFPMSSEIKAAAVDKDQQTFPLLKQNPDSLPANEDSKKAVSAYVPSISSSLEMQRIETVQLASSQDGEKTNREYKTVEPFSIILKTVTLQSEPGNPSVFPSTNQTDKLLTSVINEEDDFDVCQDTNNRPKAPLPMAGSHDYLSKQIQLKSLEGQTTDCTVEKISLKDLFLQGKQIVIEYRDLENAMRSAQTENTFSGSLLKNKNTTEIHLPQSSNHGITQVINTKRAFEPSQGLCITKKPQVEVPPLQSQKGMHNHHGLPESRQAESISSSLVSQEQENGAQFVKIPLSQTHQKTFDTYNNETPKQKVSQFSKTKEGCDLYMKTKLKQIESTSSPLSQKVSESYIENMPGQTASQFSKKHQIILHSSGFSFFVPEMNTSPVKEDSIIDLPNLPSLEGSGSLKIQMNDTLQVGSCTNIENGINKQISHESCTNKNLMQYQSEVLQSQLEAPSHHMISKQTGYLLLETNQQVTGSHSNNTPIESRSASEPSYQNVNNFNTNGMARETDLLSSQSQQKECDSSNKTKHMQSGSLSSQLHNKYDFCTANISRQNMSPSSNICQRASLSDVSNDLGQTHSLLTLLPQSQNNSPVCHFTEVPGKTVFVDSKSSKKTTDSNAKNMPQKVHTSPSVTDTLTSDSLANKTHRDNESDFLKLNQQMADFSMDDRYKPTEYPSSESHTKKRTRQTVSSSSQSNQNILEISTNQISGKNGSHHVNDSHHNKIPTDAESQSVQSHQKVDDSPTNDGCESQQSIFSQSQQKVDNSHTKKTKEKTEPSFSQSNPNKSEPCTTKISNQTESQNSKTCQESKTRRRKKSKGRKSLLTESCQKVNNSQDKSEPTESSCLLSNEKVCEALTNNRLRSTECPSSKLHHKVAEPFTNKILRQTEVAPTKSHDGANECDTIKRPWQTEFTSSEMQNNDLQEQVPTWQTHQEVSEKTCCIL